MMHLCRTRTLSLVALCVLSAGITGCGPSTGDLRGKVLFQGKPVVTGSLMLFAADGSVHHSEIASDGGYSVRKIPLGRAKVTINSPDNSALTPLERQALVESRAAVRRGHPDEADDSKIDVTELKALNDDGTPRLNPPGWMKLPASYRDPATSSLTIEVVSGTTTRDIVLE